MASDSPTETWGHTLSLSSEPQRMAAPTQHLPCKAGAMKRLPLDVAGLGRSLAQEVACALADLHLSFKGVLAPRAVPRAPGMPTVDCDYKGQPAWVLGRAGTLLGWWRWDVLADFDWSLCNWHDQEAERALCWGPAPPSQGLLAAWPPT